MEIILYSTDCPKCKILKTKLESKGLKYTENNNVDEMLNLGLTTVPALKVDDKPIMEFFEAVQWINTRRDDGNN